MASTTEEKPTRTRELMLLWCEFAYKVSRGDIPDHVLVRNVPMLEIAKPSNVLNIEGEFQKEMPMQARNNWSDFLELTPGVNARPFDDGSGRMVYFGHATEHFAHVIQLEGMNASSYRDSQVTYVGMDNEMIDDVQVKTGGVDAASPLGAIASAVRDIRGAGYSVRAISPPPTLEAQWVDSSVTDTTDVPRTVECSQSGGVLVRIRDALLPDQTISTSCPDIKELSAAYG